MLYNIYYDQWIEPMSYQRCRQAKPKGCDVLKMKALYPDTYNALHVSNLTILPINT